MAIDDRVPLGDRAALARRLPPADLELRAGVRAPVRIARDGAGVPHVYASHARDLFFGWGFAVAQDRLWQLDHFRRRARGRLAEVLGPEAVASDRTHRLLDLAGIAEAEWRAGDTESKEALEGFTAGINAWMERAASAGALPIEFEILEYAPEPWRPTDTIALQRAFLWQLTGRLDNLAAAELAHRVLGEPLATDFLRTESPDEIIMPGAVDGAGGRAASGGGDTAGGSNNWAVSPARSASGSALLASDPHLPFQLPTGLHLVHVSGAGYDATGAAYPGWPVIWMGHNGRIAWGMTNLVSSPRDLYVERLDPADPDRYRDGAGWARVERRVERIAVRGAAAVELDVRSTRRGPIVDEILPALPGDDGTARALRWVGQAPMGDLRAGLDLLRARDWTSFRRAVAGWSLPIVNVLYADADGHIGWQGVGRVPVRGTGDTTRGYRPAGDPAHEWTGTIAADALPRALDPARGWLASANNRPVADGFPAPIYGWWAPGHRAVRLRQLLDAPAGSRFSADDFRRMQSDHYSVRAEQLLPGLRRRLAASSSPAARRVLALLDGWDCHCGPEQAAPVVFETLFEHWQARVLAARFPEHTRPFLVALGAGSGLALRLLSEGAPTGWFTGGALEAELDAAATSALAELESRLGPDAARWRWGALHTVSFRHPLANRPGVEHLFATPPAPVAGTSHAINNNVFAHTGSFAVVLGQELRFVVDFADLDGAAMVLTTGQSGQPASRHYLDHLALWLRGDHPRVPFTREAVDKATTGTTRIDPLP
jgi:penicillin amidase